MVRRACIHRPQNADIVDRFTHVRVQLTDLDTTLAITAELKWGCEIFPLAVRRLLARLLLEFRLWVECVHMRWTTIHEQEDDVLGLGWKVRNLWA